MSNVVTRFRQLLHASAANAPTDEVIQSEGPAYQGLLPPEMTQIEEKLSLITYRIPELPSEFQDIPTLRQITSRDDFPDDYWKNKKALTLRRLSDSQTVEYGRQFIRALSSGVSQHHVGLIFAVAFQLRKPGVGRNPHILPDSDELQTVLDTSIDILDTTITKTFGTPTEPTEAGDEAQKAQGYAYLAASMFKMFTRSSENYEKSWKHINDGYRKFYSKSCPITGVQPHTNVLKCIHDHFTLSELMKATLYRYLYNANRDGSINSVQKYLYDIHLSHTGMQVLPIAYKICLSMNCTPVDLIRVVNSNRFRPQILGLIAAFRLMINTDEHHKRLMWKYGRIFDSDFLAALRTRSCPKFVYILACVLKRVNAKSASGILKIKQLEEVGHYERDVLWRGSTDVVAAIRAVSFARNLNFESNRSE